MRAIITLTVAGGKRLIAKAVARMPEVQRARREGKILLLIGTTVSAVAEELVEEPMRISGRITPRGLLASQVITPAPHSILIEGPKWRDVGLTLHETVSHLRENDLVIVGANIIDAYGGAAVMAASPMGGSKGSVLTGIMAEGIPILVPVGLEKLIPGTVAQAVLAAGRSRVDRSMGAAVGLMPFIGKIITEVEALTLLAPVEVQVLGKGGIDGGEGAVTMAISGEDADVEELHRLALQLRDATTSGAPESMQECMGPMPRCRRHPGCIYKSPKLAQWYLENRGSRGRVAVP